MTYTRYAIYFTPEPGPLAETAAHWLGWDIATGTPRPHPEVGPLPRPVEDITRRPRKYGFHATIKPPFHLADGTDETMLRDQAAELCATIAPVQLDGLRLSRLGGFLALTPDGDTSELNALAANVVAALDGLRAPPDAAELARRRARPLSQRQDMMLEKWGYPYVMEEFRFHMTLSGPLKSDDAPAVTTALEGLLKDALPRPFRIGALSLVGERADGCFEIVQVMPLGVAC